MHSLSAGDEAFLSFWNVVAGRVTRTDVPLHDSGMYSKYPLVGCRPSWSHVEHRPPLHRHILALAAILNAVNGPWDVPPGSEHVVTVSVPLRAVLGEVGVL